MYFGTLVPPFSLSLLLAFKLHCIIPDPRLRRQLNLETTNTWVYARVSGGMFNPAVRLQSLNLRA